MRNTVLDVTQILGQTCGHKLVVLSFVGYIGEIESDFQTVLLDISARSSQIFKQLWTRLCAMAPRSVCPISKSLFAAVGDIRLLSALFGGLVFGCDL